MGGLQRFMYGTDAAASRGRVTSRIRQHIERSQTGYQGKRILGQQVARGIFDIRVFHHSASSYLHTPIAAVCKQHEDMKRREYGFRVREIEHGCFTPLVFYTAGGIG